MIELSRADSSDCYLVRQRKDLWNWACAAGDTLVAR